MKVVVLDGNVGKSLEILKKMLHKEGIQRIVRLKRSYELPGQRMRRRVMENTRKTQRRLHRLDRIMGRSVSSK